MRLWFLRMDCLSWRGNTGLSIDSVEVWLLHESHCFHRLYQSNDRTQDWNSDFLRTSHTHRIAYKDTYADTDVNTHRLTDSRLVNRCCSAELKPLHYWSVCGRASNVLSNVSLSRAASILVYFVWSKNIFQFLKVFKKV